MENKNTKPLVSEQKIVEWLKYVYNNDVRIFVSRPNISRKRKFNYRMDISNDQQNKLGYYKIEERYNDERINSSATSDSLFPIYILTKTRNSRIFKNDQLELLFSEFYNYIPKKYFERIKKIHKLTYRDSFRKREFLLKLVGNFLSFSQWLSESNHDQENYNMLYLKSDRLSFATNEGIEIKDNIIGETINNINNEVKDKKLDLDEPLPSAITELLYRVEKENIDMEVLRLTIIILLKKLKLPNRKEKKIKKILFNDDMNPHIKAYINDTKFKVQEIIITILSEKKLDLKIGKKNSIKLDNIQFGLFNPRKKNELATTWKTLLDLTRFYISTESVDNRDKISNLNLKLQEIFGIGDSFFEKVKRNEKIIYKPEFILKDRFYYIEKKIK